MWAIQTVTSVLKNMKNGDSGAVFVGLHVARLPSAVLGSRSLQTLIEWSAIFIAEFR